MRDFRSQFSPARRNRGRRNPEPGEHGGETEGDVERNEESGIQGRLAPGDQAEEFKQLQQAVLELLDDQQRERFEATLEKMKNEPPDAFQRRGNRRPGRGRWRDRGEF